VANETSRIAFTPLLGLIPLGSPGDRNYGRLVDIVSTRFSARHAALFAEPEPVGDGSALHWYVPGMARAVRLSALPPEQAGAVFGTLERLSRDIRNYADQLDQGPRNPANRAVVEALRNALCVPGRDYVYAVNGQPVLVAWAYRFEHEEPLQVGLVRTVPLPGHPAIAPEPLSHALGTGHSASHDPAARRDAPAGDGTARTPEETSAHTAALAAAAPAAAVLKPASRSGLLWLLWLLFAAFVASILWLLLGACGINLGPGVWPSVTWCGGVQAADESSQVADLQGLVDNLEEQVARRSRECPAGRLTVLQPPAQPPPPRTSPSPPTQQQIEERKREREAQSGALEISLAWNGPADLDLHVKCPDGKVINFRLPEACGGRLQIDMNAGDKQSDRPIEHILFPSTTGLPPTGSLNIGVSWFAEKGEGRGRIEATILVKRGGQSQEKRIVIPRPPAWGGDPVFYWEIPTR
jgi:hypothetical protein